jgi:hypothetical protein
VRALILVLALAAAPAAPAAAAELDWQAVTAPDVVRIVTLDPDGEVRETKVWISLHDGRGWVRTGNSRWLENIRRDPNVKLRAGEQEVELRATEVGDPATRAAVAAAMRAKYGWSDWILQPLRWHGSHVLELSTR